MLLKKRILVCGFLNKRSIAYGISKSLYYQGAELAFICKNNKIKNKINDIIKYEFNSEIILTCDLSSDKEIKNMFIKLSKKWNYFDGFIHSISYVDSNQLRGNYLSKINKNIFIKSYCNNIYSFISMVKMSKNMLNNNASLLTLTYLGSKRVLKNYNIMGPIKASLESNVKYIAYSILKFTKKYIRVNAISSGPIYTSSSYKIKGFKKVLLNYKLKSPMNRIVNIDDIGNVAMFLISDLSLGITGEIIFVDGGFNIML